MVLGLHGQILVNSVMDPIWNTLLDNLEAYQAGKHLPHIISKSFMETFALFSLGGSGMTLAVVIIIFYSEKKMYKDVGRLAPGAGFIQCQ